MYGYGVAIDDDGGIIAVGRTNPGTIEGGFAIARFLSNGMPDTSFGNNGGIFDNSIEGPRDVVFDGDGDIFVVRCSANSSTVVSGQRWGY